MVTAAFNYGIFPLENLVSQADSKLIISLQHVVCGKLRTSCGGLLPQAKLMHCKLSTRLHCKLKNSLKAAVIVWVKFVISDLLYNYSYPLVFFKDKF